MSLKAIAQTVGEEKALASAKLAALIWEAAGYPEKAQQIRAEAENLRGRFGDAQDDKERSGEAGSDS